MPCLPSTSTRSVRFLRGEGEGEGGGDRGLSGPTLAADDLEPAHVFEPNQSVRKLRDSLWTT